MKFSENKNRQNIHFIILIILGSVKKEQFELLCTSGIRKSVDDYSTCNWGIVPSRAIVTSSATNFETRRRYQRFLEKTARILHKNKNGTTNFNRFGDQENFMNRPGYDSNQRDFENRPGYDNNQKDFENRPGYDSNQRDFENRPGYNRFDEGDYNRGGFRNPNEYGTDHWNRSRYDRRFGGNNGRGGVDGGLNSWEKPAFNDTFNYYNREGENTESANVQPIEIFELYESAPRYGLQHNLIFSVSLNILMFFLFVIRLLKFIYNAFF